MTVLLKDAKGARRLGRMLLDRKRKSCLQTEAQLSESREAPSLDGNRKAEAKALNFGTRSLQQDENAMMATGSD